MTSVNLSDVFYHNGFDNFTIQYRKYYSTLYYDRFTTFIRIEFPGALIYGIDEAYKRANSCLNLYLAIGKKSPIYNKDKGNPKRVENIEKEEQSALAKAFVDYLWEKSFYENEII